MPISCIAPVRLLTRHEFAALSSELMTDVFALRNELGRFFDECIDKQVQATLMEPTGLRALRWMNLAGHRVTMWTLR